METKEGEKILNLKAYEVLKNISNKMQGKWEIIFFAIIGFVFLTIIGLIAAVLLLVFR